MKNTDLPLIAIEPFVRECLGCECPAQVSEVVENEIRELPDIRYQRLLAGGRLLVYLLSDADSERLPERLDRLQRTGIAERDAAGCNRLRIVVPGRPGANLRRLLSARFAQNAPGDEKVHLHFVPRETLELYLGDAPRPWPVL
ncbi:hypothetical protein [Sedimenticola hydrogenitrophicus]|uniref:hypothetical protein n=1 Tax=Sedimenticola hydrogenitrophicus TaxID=2967975 RepID=UPI0021A3F16C|nr:hypothetical protein [Sedimenticola hydrogenitrophicus]